jgi:xanthosine utilization system XapX-like protein
MPAARTHRGLIAVLALAVAARVLVALAFRPALLWTDSWGYVDVAYRDSPVGFQPERPSGYPLLLHLLALPGRSLAAITTVQHLAGLATGVLVYALLLRLDVPPRLALAGAAVVLLEAGAVVLEQHVLTEALFTLTLFGAMCLAVAARGPRGLTAAGASGALLALAITMRTAAIFAVPAWLAYLALRRVGVRPALLAVGALALPLLGYSALHAQGDRTRLAGTGQFGLNEMDGWFLYSRVAPDADCRGAGVPRAVVSLCQPAAVRRDDSDFYLWSPRSPARRLFRGGRDKAEQIRDNRLLRRFALAIIAHDPWPYLGEVGGDFLRFFGPPGSGTADVTVNLPGKGETEPLAADVRDRWFPGYEQRAHAGSGVARFYARHLRAPRLLMAVLVLVALAGAVRSPRLRPEILLFAGSGLLLLLGGAATAEFTLRYLFPVVPLLVAAGILGAAGLARPAKARSTIPSTTSPLASA